MDELDKSLEDPDLKPELRERLEKVKMLQQQLCELDKDKASLEVTLSGMWKYSTYERKCHWDLVFAIFLVISENWYLNVIVVMQSNYQIHILEKNHVTPISGMKPNFLMTHY